MWKILNASIAGTSHAQFGTPCQDASKTALIVSELLGEVIVLSCADGAGSSKYASEASNAACEYLCSAVENHFKTHSEAVNIDTDMAKLWVDGIHKHLVFLANEKNENKREWACTFIGAVLTKMDSLFFQIGDGAIVTQSESNELHTVFWPDNGEYANQTSFITDDNYAERIQTIYTENSTSGIAMLTDGIQRLALDFKIQDAHAPFFKPMFEALRQSSSPQELEKDLIRFLSSEVVNERTDDDKTLVLACWC